ncbi:MAG: alpha-amylase [Leptolyngbya sp.]|nr:MAG: alpha-amylase [Leptolyngbya sp.]
MANPFKQLGDRFKALGTTTDAEALKAGKRIVIDWLNENIQELSQWKQGDHNGTLMQYFHWYLPTTGNHWQELQDRVEDIAAAGFTALWLPPPCKGSGGVYDVGYGIYDLFDLGEFDQKGTIRTKYGTKDEYLAAVKAAKQSGLQIYADVVFNHKMGGDAEEEIEAFPVDAGDRTRSMGGVERIKAWTQFNFPGRGDQYSSMKWHWWHFDSVDHNTYKPGQYQIYRFKDKSFATQVDLQQGNYDYLMGCDLDMNHEQVRGELKYWGEWMLDTVGVDGFRLDAIKHIQGDFFNDWLDHLEAYAQKDLFMVGEYWTEDLSALHWYIGNAGGRTNLFDVPLHFNFHRASRAGGSFDMRTILDNTLMQQLPLFAVTFVENHDTQPLQALESLVESWFKPLAYALILLRREGYPCVFYPDYYGVTYRDRGKDGNEYAIVMDSHKLILDRLLFARKHFAYGEQYTYFDHIDVIGWTRLGNKDHPKAMAVILSDGSGGSKWMEVGKPNTTFYDVTEHVKQPVTTNEQGWGEFSCNGGSVSVWLEKQSILSTLAGVVSP